MSEQTTEPKVEESKKVDGVAIVQFNVYQNDLLAMQKLVGDKDRKAISGVNFDLKDNSLTLTATNGRILGALRIHDAVPIWLNDGERRNFTVNCASVAKLPKMPAGKMLTVIAGQSEIVFKSGDYQVTEKIYEWPFPSWKKQIVPLSRYSKCDWNFDYNLLKLFAEAAQQMRGKGTTCISLYGHQDEQGYSVFINDARFYGVMMPMRGSEKEVPQWAKE